ncbi:hypothetical protein BCR44DRAFT_1432750 [Catenaria anguillulae PL171]|uniref:Uncharacterized protein n=1 Tax=Catenaria anguillulae PL171 TaxID=765915 RepID=A0A1Y2HNC7_9FUNG|nr:hypothetical protein BCR44DRAFT_1432750 [Catenaria anguillulae PL171]
MQSIVAHPLKPAHKRNSPSTNKHLPLPLPSNMTLCIHLGIIHTSVDSILCSSWVVLC